MIIINWKFYDVYLHDMCNKTNKLTQKHILWQSHDRTTSLISKYMLHTKNKKWTMQNHAVHIGYWHHQKVSKKHEQNISLKLRKQHQGKWYILLSENIIIMSKRLKVLDYILLFDLIDLWNICHDCVFSPKPWKVQTKYDSILTMVNAWW